MEAVNVSLIEVGTAARTIPGQSRSGDRYLVEPFPGGVLVGVVDGLGHGDEAAAAAEVAVETLRRHAGEPLVRLLRRCHADLVGTRGAVVSVASLRNPGPTMTWIGVGNAEGVLLRGDRRGEIGDQMLLLRGGFIGARLPVLQPVELLLSRGDVLLLATDGIRSDFARSVRRHDPPQRIAEGVLERSFKGTDDALVVVARVVGFDP